MILIIFTASRTFDLFKALLGDENWFFCLMALAALDGGLLGWSHFYLHGAKGDQRTVAIVSTVFDLIGVIIAFVADMFLRAGSRGVTSTLDTGAAGIVVILLAIVIAFNIGAFIMAKVLDPDTRLRHAQENATFMVENETIKEIIARAPELAKQLAQDRASMWEKHTTANAMHGSRQQWQGGSSPNGQPATASGEETTPK